MTAEQKTRIEKELAILNSGVETARWYEAPDVVVYRNLPVTVGIIPQSDVLVPIPGGYPAAMLDLAFLPQNSPLLGVLKGQPQNAITAAGSNWTGVSYHPHTNGGGKPWDPNLHGFHTYLDELLTWLSVRR